MEAISHAGTCVGLLGANGVVLAAEKKVTSKLLEPLAQSEKMFAQKKKKKQKKKTKTTTTTTTITITGKKKLSLSPCV